MFKKCLEQDGKCDLYLYLLKGTLLAIAASDIACSRRQREEENWRLEFKWFPSVCHSYQCP